mmetsp:Transcript_31064/g.34363  ORF Transcript_31064/g.34363 Transcript_31064/m.34363 type:complete len:307 (+) Transcript_31064:213-1133(+)
MIGVLKYFPTVVVLLIGAGMLVPIKNGVHSFSTGLLPKHPRTLYKQQLERSISSSNIMRSQSRDNYKSGFCAQPDTKEDEEKSGLGHDDVFCFASNKNIRRRFLRNQFVGSLAAAAASNPRAALAKGPKSRTEGYEVQRTEREWAYMLSGAQYTILRNGGTERQKSSILNTFTATDQVGTYVCAACPTALFDSADKFSSGTGWPSFARALKGVETEVIDPISASLLGREVRCRTCGGHLGDLFKDGWVYVGTQAFETGNRYCIDGAALIFKPADGGADIYGDTPPPNKMINYEQSLYRSKSINSKL